LLNAVGWRRGKGHRRGSLKRLLTAHEVVLWLLVVVSVALAGAWGYVWQQSSKESLRLSALANDTQQARSDLYRLIKEVTHARLTENPHAITVYQSHTRRIHGHLNGLRARAFTDPEHIAVQELTTAYRVIQQDMNKIFTDPYVVSDAVRMRLLNPRYEQWLVNDFETAVAGFMDLIGAQQSALQARLDQYTGWARIVIPIPVLLGAGLLLWSRRSLQLGFVRPMGDIIEGARRISEGQLEHRIPEHGVAEIEDLARAINRMAVELAASRDALVEKERQAALGALVPVVAHNIRNPLASIRATAQLIEHLDDPEDIKESRQAIIHTVDRLERWVRALLSYLHPLRPHPVRVPLATLVQGALAPLQDRLAEKAVRVDSRIDPAGAEVSVDLDLMEQALYGLLLNAVDASPPAGTVTVEASRGSEGLMLRIADEGHGLAFDPQPRELAPGPTTKRFGTGLGIPFAYKVCQAHGWGLTFEARREGGTQVKLSVPDMTRMSNGVLSE
jgi:signal transduction histidine kinase